MSTRLHFPKTLLATGCFLMCAGLQALPVDITSTELWKAAVSGNLEEMKRLRQAGHDIHTIGFSCETLLSAAAARQDEQMWNWLLKEAGFDPRRVVDLRGKEIEFGLSALVESARVGRTDWVKYLLNIGIDCTPGHMNQTGLISPLNWAAQGQHRDIARMLITAGAFRVDQNVVYEEIVKKRDTELLELLLRRKDLPPDTEFSTGEPMLVWATQNRWNEGIEVLTRYGADPNKKGAIRNKQSAFDAAPDRTTKALVMKGYALAHARATNQSEKGAEFAAALVAQDTAKIIELSKDKEARAFVTAVGNTLLHTAILQRNSTAVEILLGAGLDKNALNANGFTPLTLAVGETQDGIVEMLLKVDADPNLVAGNANVPLSLAARGGYFGLAEALIKAGAAVEPQETERWTGRTTPLMHACAGGNMQMIRYLIGLGASIHAIDNDGRSVLMWATASDSEEVIKFLIGEGADKAYQHERWGNATTYALVRGPKSTAAKALIEFGVRDDEAARWAMNRYRGDEKLIAMLSKSLSVNEADAAFWRKHGQNNGRTLTLEEVKAHIASGGDINSIEGGGTPLQLAMYGQKPDITTWLIEQGCDVNKKGSGGFPLPLVLCIIAPYHLTDSVAIAQREKECEDKLRLLLSKGANTAGAVGSETLKMAVFAGYAGCFRILMDAGADPLETEIVREGDLISDVDQTPFIPVADKQKWKEMIREAIRHHEKKQKEGNKTKSL